MYCLHLKKTISCQTISHCPTLSLFSWIGPKVHSALLMRCWTCWSVKLRNNINSGRINIPWGTENTIYYYHLGEIWQSKHAHKQYGTHQPSNFLNTFVWILEVHQSNIRTPNRSVTFHSYYLFIYKATWSSLLSLLTGLCIRLYTWKENTHRFQRFTSGYTSGCKQNKHVVFIWFYKNANSVAFKVWKSVCIGCKSNPQTSS